MLLYLNLKVLWCHRFYCLKSVKKFLNDYLNKIFCIFRFCKAITTIPAANKSRVVSLDAPRHTKLMASTRYDLLSCSLTEANEIKCIQNSLSCVRMLGNYNLKKILIYLKYMYMNENRAK